MKRFLTLTAASVAAALAASTAQAATFIIDFVAEAAVGERGITNGSSFSSANFGGLTLGFTSHDLGDGDDFFPYFDGLSGGLPGGLGVCQNLDGGVGASATGDDGSIDDCNPNDDDNVTISEGVTVTLPGPSVYSISNLSFTDQNHNSLNTSSAMLRIITDNGSMLLSFAEAVAKTLESTKALLSAITFIRFEFYDPDGEAFGQEFYVNGFWATEVPVPGALPLLLSGLAGLGFASRRRKKA